MHEPTAEGTVIGVDPVSGDIYTVLDVDSERSLTRRVQAGTIEEFNLSAFSQQVRGPVSNSHHALWSNSCMESALVPSFREQALYVMPSMPTASSVRPATGKIVSLAREAITIVSAVSPSAKCFTLSSDLLNAFACILSAKCVVPASDSDGSGAVLVAPGITVSMCSKSSAQPAQDGVSPITAASIADIDAGTLMLAQLRSKAMQALMTLISVPGNTSIALNHGMLPLIMSTALSASPLPEFVALPWLQYKAQQLLTWRADSLSGMEWAGDAARREEGAQIRLSYLLDEADNDNDGNLDEGAPLTPTSARSRGCSQGGAAGVLSSGAGVGSALSPADTHRREQACNLSAMGYDEQLCMKALAFNKDDAQRAAEWLLSGQGDAFVRAGGMEATNKDTDARGSDPRASEARELAVMVGLPQKLCTAVLEMHQGDRNGATGWLLEHGQMYATRADYATGSTPASSSRMLMSGASSRMVQGVSMSAKHVLDDMPVATQGVMNAAVPNRHAAEQPRGLHLQSGAAAALGGGNAMPDQHEMDQDDDEDAEGGLHATVVTTAGGTRGAIDVSLEPLSSASGGGITGSTLTDGQVVLLSQGFIDSCDMSLLGDDEMLATVVGGTLANNAIDIRVGHAAAGFRTVVRVPLDALRVIERVHGHPARDGSSVAFQSAAVEATLTVHAARRAVLSLLVAWPEGVPFSVRAIGGPERLLSLAKVIAASECIFGDSSPTSRAAHLGNAAASPLMLVVQSKLLSMIEAEVQATHGESSATALTGTLGILPALVDDCVRNVRQATSPQDSKEFAVRESLHPVWTPAEYSGCVSFDGAKALIITFDPSTCLPSNTGAYARLQFYAATSNGARAGRAIRNVKGGTKADTRPIIVHGDRVAYTYVSTTSELQTSSESWGYRFFVAPMAGLQWLCEEQVLHNPSLEWACWLLRLLQGASPVGHADAAAALVHSPNIADALLSYIRTPSVPFKSLVVNILSQLLQRPYLYMQHFRLYGGGQNSTALFNTRAAPNFSGLTDVEGVVSEAISEAKVKHAVFLPPQLQALAEMCAAGRSAHMALHSGQGPLTPFDVTNAFTKGGLLSGAKLKQPVTREPIPTEAQLDVRGLLLDVYDMSRALLASSRQPDRVLCIVAVAMDKGWHGSGSASESIDAPRISDSAIESAVRGLAGWFPLMDEQLVKYSMSAASDSGAGVDDVDPSVVGAKSDAARRSGDLDARFPALSRADRPALQARLALVQLFNRRLANCIESVDLSRTHVKWSLAHRLRKLGHIILPDTKTRLVDAAIDASWAPGPCGLRITLDNNSAFASADRNIRDPAVSDCIFMQCFRQLHRARPAAFRCKLDERQRLFYVTFRREDGMDWGGLYREAVTRSVEEVFSKQLDLLLPTPNSIAQDGMCTDKYLPNPERVSPEMLDAFEFLGRLMGISMRQKLYLPFEFPPMVWKYLTGQELGISEIMDVDRETATRLHRLTSAGESSDAAAMEGETFTILSASGSLVELVGNGAETDVTPADAETFVKLALQFRLHEFDPALESLRAGFVSVVPERVLSLCSASELEALTCGDPVIDIELLRAKTAYHGYHKNDKTCKYFWAVLKSFSNEDRSRFIRFVWGRSRLPKPAEWGDDRPFKLTSKGGGDGALPIAHTCFRQLECPAYSSEAIMRQRLMTAMHYGMDGFLIA
jgi:E3 ubiquitin-protein ligase HERC2